MIYVEFKVMFALLFVLMIGGIAQILFYLKKVMDYQNGKTTTEETEEWVIPIEIQYFHDYGAKHVRKLLSPSVVSTIPLSLSIVLWFLPEKWLLAGQVWPWSAIILMSILILVLMLVVIQRLSYKLHRWWPTLKIVVISLFFVLFFLLPLWRSFP